MNGGVDAVLRSGCKINLYLRVGTRRHDGLHTLETLFLPLYKPHDILEIRETAKPGTICVHFVDLAPERQISALIPAQENTITRAYAWYTRITGYAPGLDVLVHKGVPHGAGLGGGSANAAALIKYLQKKAVRPLSPPMDKNLIRSAVAIGADVPFFLLGKTAFASEAGEALTPVDNTLSGFFLVLVCPGIGISTAWAFAALDKSREKRPSACSVKKKGGQPANDLTISFCQATNTLALAKRHGNDFESVVFARYPKICAFKKRLKDAGAELAGMSGTGSSVFALFRDRLVAQKIAKELEKEGVRVYILRA